MYGYGFECDQFEYINYDSGLVMDFERKIQFALNQMNSGSDLSTGYADHGYDSEGCDSTDEGLKKALRKSILRKVKRVLRSSIN